jgi:hypothetical protein
MTGVD